MYADPIPFPISSSVPSPSPIIAPPMFHPFPPEHISFSRKFSEEVWGAL